MELFHEMVTYVIIVVTGLLPIANPFSTAPVFLAMTSDSSSETRRILAFRSSCYMAAMLLIFLFAGAMLLGFFGITIPGLRIAGGIIIMIVGLRMLFPHPESEEIASVEEKDVNRLAFTPLAMPLLSGPGSISVVLSMSDKVANLEDKMRMVYGYLVVAVGIILTAVICWLVLRSSTQITRFFGTSGIDVLTRVMAFFLVAIGVEFLLEGISNFIETLGAQS